VKEYEEFVSKERKDILLAAAELEVLGTRQEKSRRGAINAPPRACGAVKIEPGVYMLRLFCEIGDFAKFPVILQINQNRGMFAKSP